LLLLLLLLLALVLALPIAHTMLAAPFLWGGFRSGAEGPQAAAVAVISRRHSLIP
jgi:hypothetical protein